MKTRTIVFGCILFGCSLQYLNCKSLNKKAMDLSKEVGNTEKDTILKIAADTAISLYGYDIIQSELPFEAKLENDSIWVVKGTLEKGLKGGTVYIEILRRNKKVITITHYK
jgi:hypothetical protein